MFLYLTGQRRAIECTVPGVRQSWAAVPWGPPRLSGVEQGELLIAHKPVAWPGGYPSSAGLGRSLLALSCFCGQLAQHWHWPHLEGEGPSHGSLILRCCLELVHLGTPGPAGQSGAWSPLRRRQGVGPPGQLEVTSPTRFKE